MFLHFRVAKSNVLISKGRQCHAMPLRPTCSIVPTTTSFRNLKPLLVDAVILTSSPTSDNFLWRSARLADLQDILPLWKCFWQPPPALVSTTVVSVHIFSKGSHTKWGFDAHKFLGYAMGILLTCEGSKQQSGIMLPFLKVYFPWNSFDFIRSGLYGSSSTTTMLSTWIFPKAVIASREHQRHPGVWRPLVCSALAGPQLHWGAFWVNACQTFTCFNFPDSQQKTHKKWRMEGVYGGLKGREWRGCVCQWTCLRVCGSWLVCMCLHYMDLFVWAGPCVHVCVCLPLSAQCRWVAEWLLQPNDSVC